MKETEKNLVVYMVKDDYRELAIEPGFSRMKTTHKTQVRGRMYVKAKQWEKDCGQIDWGKWSVWWAGGKGKVKCDHMVPCGTQEPAWPMKAGEGLGESHFFVL